MEMPAEIARQIPTQMPAQMPREPDPEQSAAALLRVVGGLHCGAHASLSRPGLIVIGSSEDCDLVLMDQGVAARHAAITLYEHGTVVRALEGSVSLGGLQVAPGEAAELPPGVPLALGQASILIGTESDFAAAEALEDERSSSEEAPANPGDSAATGADDGTVPPAALRRRAMLKSLAGCAMAAVLVIAAVSLSSTLRPQAETPEQHIASVLKELGLAAEITVTEAEPGVLALTGTTPDESSHSKLIQRLAAEDLKPVLRLSIGERLAAGVKDVFRVNGLDVEAEYKEAGVVLVRGLRGPRKLYDRVIDHALKDVRGLNAIRIDPGQQEGSLILANGGPIVDLGRPGSIDPAAKRVVSVVDSTPAYIVTADGARYFVGSLLPQGHRVLGIEGTSVTLERDGEQLVMTF